VTIRVELGPRSYDIHVGRGLLGKADALLRLPEHARNIIIVTQPSVAKAHLTPLRGALDRLGLPVHETVVPDGEVAKDVTVLSSLWNTFASVPLGRDDVVVALGGGVVGDLAGFAAATWNRGVAVVQVPTTLLAQVDSAIGGKTGINLPAGKNLVGAFHQPHAVLADVATLATLPRRQVIAGLGEVVKYGFIRDPYILALLEADPGGAAGGDPDLLEELVRRSAAVKAAVVSGDERESGERAHLNFGHTFGHAVEAGTGYTQVLHGEAVAIGMAMALRLGVAEGVTSQSLVGRNDELCAQLGLPTKAPALDRGDLWRTMARDKKARDGIRWALLSGLGQVTVQHADRANVDAAIDAVQS
jgi:3-dehydroquinate synthase